jgi:hypothetical protein
MENPLWMPTTRCFSPSLSAKPASSRRETRPRTSAAERRSPSARFDRPGAATYNIRGRTIHTALGIDVCDRARSSVEPQFYSLWQGRTILFVDEISMVSLTLLNTINQQCNRIRVVGQDSTAVFSSLPIVVFMEDFHQFAPIKAKPLWKTSKNPRASHGRLVWQRFTDVVILDEQMRQATDSEFCHAREGTISEADIKALNAHGVQSLWP